MTIWLSIVKRIFPHTPYPMPHARSHCHSSTLTPTRAGIKQIKVENYWNMILKDDRTESDFWTGSPTQFALHLRVTWLNRVKFFVGSQTLAIAPHIKLFGGRGAALSPYKESKFKALLHPKFSTFRLPIFVYHLVYYAAYAAALCFVWLPLLGASSEFEVLHNFQFELWLFCLCWESQITDAKVHARGITYTQIVVHNFGLMSFQSACTMGLLILFFMQVLGKLILHQMLYKYYTQNFFVNAWEQISSFVNTNKLMTIMPLIYAAH